MFLGETPPFSRTYSSSCPCWLPTSLSVGFRPHCMMSSQMISSKHQFHTSVSDVILVAYTVESTIRTAWALFLLLILEHSWTSSNIYFCPFYQIQIRIMFVTCPIIPSLAPPSSQPRPLSPSTKQVSSPNRYKPQIPSHYYPSSTTSTPPQPPPLFLVSIILTPNKNIKSTYVFPHDL